MVSKQAELTASLEEYKRLSAEIQELCEDIISTADPDAEWVGEVRRSYRDFLDDDAETIKALDTEIQKAEQDEDAKRSGRANNLEAR